MAARRLSGKQGEGDRAVIQRKAIEPVAVAGQRPVQVLADGMWLSGSLRAQRKDNNGWCVLVEYTCNGATRFAWVTLDQVRHEGRTPPVPARGHLGPGPPAEASASHRRGRVS